MNTLPSVTLWNHQGTSDKIYKLAVIELEFGNYVVNFAYGRRGSTLKTGTKTQAPVTLEVATKLYEKLLKGQLTDGYEVLEGESGTPQTPTGIGSSVIRDVDQRDSGLYPQLLVAISEDEAERYLTDDDWAAQEKFDGKRMTISKTTDQVMAVNKKGLSIGFPDAINQAVGKFMSSFITDGESIGDRLYAFDMLEVNSVSLRPMPYKTRLKYLNEMLLDAGKDKVILVAKTAIGTTAKRKLMADLKAAGKEGIVFKRLSAPWSAGRPESGGPAQKCKFWSSCSCVVTGINAKRSVNIGLFNGDEGTLSETVAKPIGKVTIPPNHVIPLIGQVIEAKYLYVVAKGGSLYQPIYLGPREDVDVSECTFDQQKLKYKAENED